MAAEGSEEAAVGVAAAGLAAGLRAVVGMAVLLAAVWADAKAVLMVAGYSVIAVRLNSAACGVAQVRRRVFVIAMQSASPSALQLSR